MTAPTSPDPVLADPPAPPAAASAAPSDGSSPAGVYELLVGAWEQQTSEIGKPYEFKAHKRGALVELDAEQATVMVANGSVGKPGQREQDEADRLMRAAEAADAAAQAARDRVEAAKAVADKAATGKK